MIRRALVAALVLAILTTPPAAVAQEGETRPYRDPALAAGMSLLLPGSGHAWLGVGGRGAGWAALAGVGLAFGLGWFALGTEGNDAQVAEAMGWAMFGTASVGSAWGAWQEAEAQNLRHGYLIDDDLAARVEPGPRVTLWRQAF